MAGVGCSNGMDGQGYIYTHTHTHIDCCNGHGCYLYFGMSRLKLSTARRSNPCSDGCTEARLLRKKIMLDKLFDFFLAVSEAN